MHEPHWRSLSSEITHWEGCTAGETTLGLEADGTIKSCPSLPKSHYAGGESRSVSIDEALRNLSDRTVRRDGNRGRSFCGSCYYWNTCRGGCTWVSHVLESRRGDNPYCYYRATTLARRGLRERIVKVAEAIVIVKLTFAVCAVGVVESVTVKASAVALTAAVGAPLIAPVVEFSVTPAGSVPEVSIHV